MTRNSEDGSHTQYERQIRDSPGDRIRDSRVPIRDDLFKSLWLHRARWRFKNILIHTRAVGRRSNTATQQVAIKYHVSRQDQSLPDP